MTDTTWFIAMKLGPGMHATQLASSPKLSFVSRMAELYINSKPMGMYKADPHWPMGTAWRAKDHSVYVVADIRSQDREIYAALTAEDALMMVKQPRGIDILEEV